MPEMEDVVRGVLDDAFRYAIPGRFWDYVRGALSVHGVVVIAKHREKGVTVVVVQVGDEEISVDWTPPQRRHS